METSDIRISSKFGCFNLNISTKFSFLVPPPVSEGRAISPHKGLPWVRLQICASLADNWIYEYYLQLSLLWATPSPIWRWQTAAANRWFIQVLIVHLEVSWNKGTPNHLFIYRWIFHYKPSILGYPHLWKSPFISFYIHKYWDTEGMMPCHVVSSHTFPCWSTCMILEVFFLRRQIFLSFCNTNIINHHQDENPARCYARRPKHQVNRWLYTQAVIKPGYTSSLTSEQNWWRSRWSSGSTCGHCEHRWIRHPKKKCRRAILATSRTCWFVWKRMVEREIAPFSEIPTCRPLPLK